MVLSARLDRKNDEDDDKGVPDKRENKTRSYYNFCALVLAENSDEDGETKIKKFEKYPV